VLRHCFADIFAVRLIEIPAPDFDLAMTLDSGQVFHWEKAGDGFVGTIGAHAVYVEQRSDLLQTASGERELDRLNRSSLRRLVGNYLALDHPLAEICASFPDDPAMNAARKFCRGLRIIRQPKWECLATFICSSMKQVAHIRQISRKLRERFGEARKIELQRALENATGGSAAPSGDAEQMRLRRRDFNIERRSARSTNVFTFPSAKRLARTSEKELRECALGYRAKNLLATARLIANGDIDLEEMSILSDVDLCGRLCELPGVGAKVANCVMLFAYERLRAFPIDVWIERVLRQKYFPRTRKLKPARLRLFAEKYFTEHGGYAQQYLFHHARVGSRASAAARDSSTPKAFGARNDKKAGAKLTRRSKVVTGRRVR
jgi:N-glycosylase/DNA lyase